MENVSEKLTGVANIKEQVLYSVLYVIAAVGMVVMGAPWYVAVMLFLGTVLYNVSKIGKNEAWFEEDSKTAWIIGIAYLVSVGVGVIVGLLFTLDLV
jgi:flagellar biosynthesis protein FliQ